MRWHPSYGLWTGFSRLLLLALSLLALPSSAQNNSIDSLRTVLPFLPDPARVDALNQLCYSFILTEQKDSAQQYAAEAYRAAIQQNDAHGLAVYYCNQAQIAKHFDDDFQKSEQLAKTALQWYDRTSNQDGILQAYFYVQYATFAQGKFDESLAYAKKQYAYSKQTGNEKGMLDAIGSLYAIYRQSGNYEKSFQFAQQRYEQALRFNDKIGIANALYSFAQLYELIEDYGNALHYFRLALQMDDDETRQERIATDNDIWFKMEFTEAFAHLRQFDSAWHYYRLYKPAQPVYLRVWWISTGECYLLQNDYPHALQNLQLGLTEHRKLNDRNEIMRALLDLGKTHLALGNNRTSIDYGREGLAMALELKSKQYIRDGYQILSTVYDRLQQTDSANFYFRRYTTAKDEVLSEQAKGRFAAYQYEQKLALANKEIELHAAQLKNETLVKRVLMAGLVLLVFCGVIVIRNLVLKRRNERQKLEHQLQVQELESERTQAQLQQEAAELEMQALRVQMNPHFIFNSLNSINHFILQNNKLQASEYLTKFSRLTRLILQNSQSALISLESELEALQLYLELEALRFNHRFVFVIAVDDDLDSSAINIPPLIIQPYVENAIWHGLMHKEEQGHLAISISQLADRLLCTITDDGIGRKKAAEAEHSSGTHKSVGMRITADRIALLQVKKQDEDFVTVKDLVLPDGRAGGTAVTLRIPVHADEGHAG